MNIVFPLKNATIFTRLTAIAGGSAMILGLIAFTGYLTGVTTFASVLPGYLPMASATSILTTFFGAIFLTGIYRVPKGKLRYLIIGVVCLFTLYGLFKFLEYFTGTELTLDSYVFPVKETFGKFPVNRSSPITGLFFFLSGAAVLLKILGRERRTYLNLVSGTGLIIFYAGFTGFMGYILGTPLFYEWDIIPVSLLTTIVFIILGFGLATMGGLESFFFRQVSGNSASARLLRAFLPVIILFLLLDDIVDAILVQLSPANHVLISGVFAMIVIPIAIIVLIKVSQTIFKRADLAEEERKKAVASLLESEKRYRILIENLGEGIGLVDPSENFVFCNPAAELIFDVPPGGLVHRNIQEFLPPEQLALLFQETEKRSRKERSSYEIVISTAKKQQRIILVTASPQFNDEGTFIGTFGVFRDITERKEVEAKLEKFAVDLQESNATKDKFFSIIAHDLKSPFNAILGLTNLMIDEYQTYNEEEIEKALSTIRNSSVKAFELLENLLVWANSQTGRISYNPEEVNLRQITEESISLFEVPASRKQIHIVSGTKEDCLVIGDIQMLHTIMRNLVSNAVKFTHPGGEVSINIIRREGYFEISVTDTGVGIAARDIEKLFKIENKYSTSGTSDEKGTGLGLILCREFVEKHGGTIWVESAAGTGSKFCFTIPVLNPDIS